MTRRTLSKRDISFWRAYFEILNERVPLVDIWDDGTITWQPRIVQKLLWYSKIPNTMGYRHLAYEWLMLNCTRSV
jgi:hypothetical protein